MTTYRVQRWTGRMQSGGAGTREVITDPGRARKGTASEKKATAIAISLAAAVCILILSILISDLSALHQNKMNMNRLTRKIENLESSVSDLQTELDGKTRFLAPISGNSGEASVVQIYVP